MENSGSFLLSLIAFMPLIGILVLAFIPRDKAGTIKLIGILATLPSLLLSFVMYAKFDFAQAGMQFVQKLDWIHIPLIINTEQRVLFINYELGVDGLSMPLVLLAAIIGTLAAVASMAISKRWKEYFILFLLTEIGTLGLFMSLNLFLFFIFFEIALIPMFFLIAIYGYLDREKAAMKFLLYNGVGSAILLITFVTLFIKTSTLNILEITESLTNPMSYINMNGFFSEELRLGLFIALLIAFGIKIPIVPFHTWMLKSYQESPVPMIMISSGIMIKMGAYGLIRMGVGFFPEWAVALAELLAILGVINILYGAVLAFVQRDLKMVLAYSSVSHMGIILLGIASMNITGFQGAIFQMVSHGMIAALLFFIIGVISERTGTTVIGELGGLAKSMPFNSGVFMAAAMASLGLPGMSGFISEFQSFMGLFREMPIIAAIGTLGIILAAAYLLRAVLRTTFGPTPERWQGIMDTRPVEVLPMAILLGFVVLIGVYPAVLGDVLQGTLPNLVPRIGG